MINFLKSIFSPKSSSTTDEELLPERKTIVTFDDEQIQVQQSNGNKEQIRWKDLLAVTIETTDEGPFLPDVFWILVGKNMESGCVFPQDSTGDSDLIEELQKRLPDFDNEQFIEAMRSTDNNRFVVWKKDNPNQTSLTTPAAPRPTS
ncbi:hypothetical protein VDG1235_582 [Verrucomicrobiia bacterium DG1235]|nr:hypothetical protein VDG1235_582 [Verrucomicrobiae bacterium DG1235]